MKVQVVGYWSSTAYGNRRDGETLEVEDNEQTQSMVKRGYFKPYDTKVVHRQPKKPADSGLSQADQPAQKPKKSSKPKTKAK